METTMRKKALIILLIFLGLTILSCAAPKTNISVLRPSAVDMSQHRNIAIADFNGPENSGSVVATKLASALFESQYFNIMERSRIQEILSEQAMGLSGAVDPETAAELGKILGVDAIIFGEVGAYRVSDKSGKEKVKKQVWTGEYEKDENGKIVYQKTLFGKEKKKKYEEKLVDEPYVVRSGAVQISFRVVDVETAKLLAVKTASDEYSKKATGTDDIGRLKPNDAILSSLTDNVVSKFVPVIAPYRVQVTKQFEKGSDRTKKAIKLAQAGFPEKALPLFEQEAQVEPSAKSFYNLGLCNEIMGNYDEAESQYDHAVNMEPKGLYLEALKGIQQLKEEKNILEERE